MEKYNENIKVLYVDDEPEMLAAFRALMRKENAEVFTLQDSSRISQFINEAGPFALVLSDQRMPVFDGAEVLKKTKEQSYNTIRVLVTGYSDYEDTIRAINDGGIHSYISKPWDDNRLKQQVQEWLGQYNLREHNKYLLALLDEENQKLNGLLEGTVAQTVSILGDMANHISPQVSDLSAKVKLIGVNFLNSITNLSRQEKWEINCAFDLFNLGIAMLPLSIQVGVAEKGLSRLNESVTAQTHFLIASGLLKKIPRFAPVAQMIELQAKDFNGQGEPVAEEIRGKDIPYGARLLHILIDMVRPSGSLLRGTKRLLQMENMPQKYDVDIIRQILNKNVVENFIMEEKMLAINELLPGMILIEDVRAVGGQLLLKANLSLTDTFINILYQWNKSDPVIEPIRVKYML